MNTCYPCAIMSLVLPHRAMVTALDTIIRDFSALKSNSNELGTGVPSSRNKRCSPTIVGVRLSGRGWPDTALENAAGGDGTREEGEGRTVKEGKKRQAGGGR
eukprot:759550-Hanusia_phi.AAC.1